jgi:kumamolisin
MNNSKHLSNGAETSAPAPLKAICIKGLTAALQALAVAAFLFTALTPAPAQEEASGDGVAQLPVKRPKMTPGTLVIPASSMATAADKGKRAHTNLRYIVPSTYTFSFAPGNSDSFETPASISCVYHLVTPVKGCSPLSVTKTATGGSEAIAIVDAYDTPEAGADLAYFSEQFNIPFSPEKFQVFYENAGYPPSMDETGGWALETSLDLQWAHAMAPDATLYLVEASSNLDSDLYTSVGIAVNLVQCGKPTTCPTNSKGKGIVSMSWGSEEYAGETANDATVFTANNVVFVAAAGDSPGTSYPCVVPNVVCVGGSTINRNPVSGDQIAETPWDDSGDGISQYESIPKYQSPIASIVGKFRGVPDVAMDANPNTGLWVYDTNAIDYYTYEGPWWIVGGTSASTQMFAGIISAAGKGAASGSAELTTIYAARATAADYTDITSGYCGPYSGLLAAKGWDFCTGVGTPVGLVGK